MKLFTRKPKQVTWVYCPNCKVDLCSAPHVAFVDPDADGLVRYACQCGEVSQWDFDLAPAPVLVRRMGTLGTLVSPDGRLANE